MKVYEKEPNRCQCKHCGAGLIVEDGDLKWTHTEPDMYYVTCEECGKRLWITPNDFYDAMWKRQQENKLQ